jgi:hypothetical protein
MKKLALRDSYVTQGVRDAVTGVLPMGKILTTVIEEDATLKEKLLRLGARVAGSATGGVAGLVTVPFSSDHSTRNLIKRVIIGSMLGEALLGPYPVREKLGSLGDILKKVRLSQKAREGAKELGKNLSEEAFKSSVKHEREKRAYRGTSSSVQQGSYQQSFGQREPDQKGNLLGAIGKGVGIAAGTMGALQGGHHIFRHAMKNRTAMREFSRQGQMAGKAYKANKPSSIGAKLTPRAELDAMAQNRRTAFQRSLENNRNIAKYKNENMGIIPAMKSLGRGFKRDFQRIKNINKPIQGPARPVKDTGYSIK